jgi:peptide/nickel transport system ATP-binding protein/oligopeptide transport system ATP-binding protein
MPPNMLEIHDLTVRYALRGGDALTVVDGVRLSVRRGATLGLVGESGCGKSTLARAVMRLIPAARGRVLLDGDDVLAARGAALMGVRRRMQMVFQDPLASLNPRHTIGRIVGEGLDVHRIGDPASRRARVAQTLEAVGLSGEFTGRYPHALSGGQRQRVAIARALVLEPDVLILDEPVSALDVSVQSQVLNLLADLQARLGLTYIFIGHHLGVVRHISDDVAVMYLGRIVESGPADRVLSRPRHPYTHALLSSVLETGPNATLRPVLPGEPPSPASRPSGCAFHPRCAFARPVCGEKPPDLMAAGDAVDSKSTCLCACVRAGEITLPSALEAREAARGA